MLEDVKNKIEEYLTSIIEEKGIELVDLIVHRRQKRVAIEVLADKPGGGITVEECTWINKLLVKKIDEEVLIIGDYTVEVSSPGLDRPLKTTKDFLRVIGRPVRFLLKESFADKWEHVGVVQGVEVSNIVILAKEKTYSLPLEKIQKAVQVV